MTLEETMLAARYPIGARVDTPHGEGTVAGYDNYLADEQGFIDPKGQPYYTGRVDVTLDDSPFTFGTAAYYPPDLRLQSA